MKKHLFYLVLVIFGATAAATLAALVELITIKEKYLDALVTLLLLEVAAAAIGLFKGADFFSEEAAASTASAPDPVPPPPPAERLPTPEPPAERVPSQPPMPVPSSAPASIEGKSSKPKRQSKRAPASEVSEHLDAVAKVEDRFGEKLQLTKAALGKRMTGVGYVLSLEEAEDDLMLFVSRISPGGGIFFYCSLDPAFRERALQLRKGDLVEIVGIADIGIPLCLDEATFRRIEEADHLPPPPPSSDIDVARSSGKTKLAPESEVSMFFDQFHRVKDRFGERAELEKSVRGKSITGIGYVTSVSQSTSGTHLWAAVDESERQEFYAIVLPAEQEAALRLRKGDLVEVTGKCDGGVYPVRLHDATFRRIDEPAVPRFTIQ